MLFHLDKGKPQAAIHSAFSKHAKNYDHDRIEAQADYAAAIVRRLLKLRAPVTVWELGKRGIGPLRRVTMPGWRPPSLSRFASSTPRLPLSPWAWAREWLAECVGELRRQEALKHIDSFNAHYPFGTWPGPRTPDERTSPLALVRGDVLFRPLVRRGKYTKKELGIASPSMAVTETMVFKFGAPYWEPFNLIGTQAHALRYAWNWITLLADPRCNIAAFHDLETTFFGMLRYNVGYDAAARRFVWLDGAKPDHKLTRFPEQYVLSPTCAANRMLSSLVDHRVGLATIRPEDPSLRILWGADQSGGRPGGSGQPLEPEQNRIVSRNDARRGESLTAEDLGSVLPGKYNIASLTSTQGIELIGLFCRHGRSR